MRSCCRKYQLPFRKKKKKVVFDLLLILLGQKLGSFSAKKRLALGQMILH